jgi:hypothetical protein
MKSLRKKANAVRASHPDRIPTWFSALALITAWRRNDRFGPAALQRSAACAQASCRFVILRSRTCDPCGGQRSFLLVAPKSNQQGGGGGRNARATSRACARFLEYPPAIHPRESPAPLALPQAFGKLRNSHVSLNPLSARRLALATQKTCALVQNLWRTRLPCGRLRKTKNESLPPSCSLVISMTCTL